MIGWCAAENGDLDRGIGLLTEAISALQAIQSHHTMAYLLGLLADAQIKAGHHADAMKAVEHGIALAETGGERYYSAELNRLRGELLARPPYCRRRQAEASFRAAIKVAELQGAAVLEHRANASMLSWCG